MSYIWNDITGLNDTNKTIINHTLKECTKFDFGDTDYGTNFYKSYENEFLYCLKPEDQIHLKGTRDWDYLN